ncbi:MAG: DMT family transporter [Oscillospiraceae bacterium]|nr:DMT family transporter [Oscillospiraceae bacterium]
MNKTTARPLMFLAMLIFGTIGLLVRSIPLPSSVIALTRGSVGCVFLLLLMLLQKHRPDAAAIRKNLKWLLPAGVFLGFNWILLFESYRYTSVAVGTLCYYMAPILVVLSSPVLLHERLTARKVICVLLALVGMVGVSGVVQSGLPSASETTGILLGLAAAVLYACIVLLNKQLADISAYDRTVVQLGICAVVMLVYCAATVPLASLEFTPTTIGLLLVAGVLHTGVTYYLYFGSMAYLSGQTAAILSYVDPVVAVLVSVLVLAEPMHPVELLGAVLVLGAALASELEKPA